MGTNKGIVLALCLVAISASGTVAEPSYLIYPSSPSVFRFDPGRYEIVTSSDPKFQAGFAIGGQMLWDRVENRLPVEVYRAPELIGFEPSPGATSEYATFRTEFDVIIDGFSPTPCTLGSLCLRFWPDAAAPLTHLELNGAPLQRWTAELPPLEVFTPVDPGFFADTRTFAVSWQGPSVMRVIAFSDKDGDGAFQGTPRFGIVSMNAAVPVSSTTWGRVKSLYR